MLLEGRALFSTYSQTHKNRRTWIGATNAAEPITTCVLWDCPFLNSKMIQSRAADGTEPHFEVIGFWLSVWSPIEWNEIWIEQYFGYNVVEMVPAKNLKKQAENIWTLILTAKYSDSPLMIERVGKGSYSFVRAPKNWYGLWNVCNENEGYSSRLAKANKSGELSSRFIAAKNSDSMKRRFGLQGN